MATPSMMPNQYEDDSTLANQRCQALLVEDMPIMVKILGRALDQLGISYDHAPNGRDAVEAARDGSYDIIFMDIMMPTMNGVDATQHIRAIERKSGKSATPIIAVTTKMSDAETDGYREAGITDCIKKPVDKVSLEVLLARYLPEIGTPSIDTGEKYDVLSDEMEFVNWDTLHEYGTLFKSGLAGLVQDYLAAAPGLLEMMHKAVKERDAERIHMFASQLKSASAVFGADRLSHLAARMEILVGKHQLDAVESLYLDLHMAFEHTKNALTKKLVVLQNL